MRQLLPAKALGCFARTSIDAAEMDNFLAICWTTGIVMLSWCMIHERSLLISHVIYTVHCALKNSLSIYIYIHSCLVDIACQSAHSQNIWSPRPQYKEDVETINMCLESVASSTYAKSSIGVVLAMEEREEGAAGVAGKGWHAMIVEKIADKDVHSRHWSDTCDQFWTCHWRRKSEGNHGSIQWQILGALSFKWQWLSYETPAKPVQLFQVGNGRLHRKKCKVLLMRGIHSITAGNNLDFNASLVMPRKEPRTWRPSFTQRIYQMILQAKQAMLRMLLSNSLRLWVIARMWFSQLQMLIRSLALDISRVSHVNLHQANLDIQFGNLRCSIWRTIIDSLHQWWLALCSHPCNSGSR